MKKKSGKGTGEPGSKLDPKEKTDLSTIITIEDMIPSIMEKTNLSEAKVREVLTLFPQTIKEAVKKGKTASLDDLGEFSLSKYIPISRKKRGTGLQ